MFVVSKGAGGQDGTAGEAGRHHQPAERTAAWMCPFSWAFPLIRILTR